MKLLEKIKKYLFSKNSLTRYLYLLYVKKILVRLEKDEVGVVCEYNLGETYLFCSLADSFKRQNDIEKIVLISQKKYHADICEMFSGNIDRCYVNSDLYLRPLRDFRVIRKGAFYYLYDYKNWNYNSLVERKTTNLEMLKVSAGISPEAKVQHCLHKEVDKIMAQKIFSQLGLRRDRTVLLSPEAKTCSNLTEQFCHCICGKLSSKGYDVFLNVTNTVKMDSYTKTAFLPLGVAAAFCDLCGHVIAVRSGFCDIISSSNAKLHIIYPDQTFQQVFPVKDFMLSDYVKEYILDEIPGMDMVEMIINNIES